MLIKIEILSLPLILKSFSAKGVAEQRLIYEQNRPLPKLGLHCGGRKFRFEWYGKKGWFCGCEGKQGLFCWPCLPFRPGLSTTWTVTSYKNMQGLLSDCKKHEASKSHMGGGIKRGKPPIYLSLRGFTRSFQEREGRRSSMTTRRLYRLYAYNVIPLASIRSAVIFLEINI